MGVTLLGVVVRSTPSRTAPCRVSQVPACLCGPRRGGGYLAPGGAPAADDECRHQDGDYSDARHCQPQGAGRGNGQYRVRFVNHGGRVPQINTNLPTATRQPDQRRSRAGCLTPDQAWSVLEAMRQRASPGAWHRKLSPTPNRTTPGNGTRTNAAWTSNDQRRALRACGTVACGHPQFMRLVTGRVKQTGA